MDVVLNLIVAALLFWGGWRIIAWKRDAARLRAQAEPAPPPQPYVSGHMIQGQVLALADAHRAELNLKVRRGELDPAKVEPMMQEFISAAWKRLDPRTFA
jgi:hypothetical protein